MGEVTNKDLYEELGKLRHELDTADRDIESKVTVLEQKVDRTYVKLIEFEPVRKIVYGLVGAVLLSVIAALLALVIRSSQ
jgi:hypothetical protein